MSFTVSGSTMNFSDRYPKDKNRKSTKHRHIPDHCNSAKKHNCCETMSDTTMGSSVLFPRPITRRHPNEMPPKAQCKFRTQTEEQRNDRKLGIFSNGCVYARPNDRWRKNARTFHHTSSLKNTDDNKKIIPQRISGVVNVKSRSEEQEYLHFLLRITEDIIVNNFVTNEDIENVFHNHIEANRERLCMENMLAQIARLCKEINVPYENCVGRLLNRKGCPDVPVASYTGDYHLDRKNSECNLALSLQTAFQRQIVEPMKKIEGNLSGFQEVAQRTESAQNEIGNILANRHSLSRLTECTEPTNSIDTIGNSAKISSDATISSFGTVDVLPCFEQQDNIDIEDAELIEQERSESVKEETLVNKQKEKFINQCSGMENEDSDENNVTYDVTSNPSQVSQGALGEACSVGVEGNNVPDYFKIGGGDTTRNSIEPNESITKDLPNMKQIDEGGKKNCEHATPYDSMSLYLKPKSIQVFHVSSQDFENIHKPEGHLTNYFQIAKSRAKTGDSTICPECESFFLKQKDVLNSITKPVNTKSQGFFLNVKNNISDMQTTKLLTTSLENKENQASVSFFLNPSSYVSSHDNGVNKASSESGIKRLEKEMLTLFFKPKGPVILRSDNVKKEGFFLKLKDVDTIVTNTTTVPGDYRTTNENLPETGKPEQGFLTLVDNLPYKPNVSTEKNQIPIESENKLNKSTSITDNKNEESIATSIENFASDNEIPIIPSENGSVTTCSEDEALNKESNSSLFKRKDNNSTHFSSVKNPRANSLPVRVEDIASSETANVANNNDQTGANKGANVGTSDKFTQVTTPFANKKCNTDQIFGFDNIENDDEYLLVNGPVFVLKSVLNAKENLIMYKESNSLPQSNDIISYEPLSSQSPKFTSWSHIKNPYLNSFDDRKNSFSSRLMNDEYDLTPQREVDAQTSFSIVNIDELEGNSSSNLLLEDDYTLFIDQQVKQTNESDHINGHELEDNFNDYGIPNFGGAQENFYEISAHPIHENNHYSVYNVTENADMLLDVYNLHASDCIEAGKNVQKMSHKISDTIPSQSSFPRDATVSHNFFKKNCPSGSSQVTRLDEESPTCSFRSEITHYSEQRVHLGKRKFNNSF